MSTSPAPLNMKETVFALSEEQKKRLMQGHDSDGKALPDVPTGSIIVGSGGQRRTTFCAGCNGISTA
jgi:D-alanyl-D-alanine-carboxypeptidase/D-alanyl-D-alanine-endopeptidase